jgi:hypothetical protein
MGTATGSQRELTFAATEQGSRRRESALKGFRNGRPQQAVSAN